MQENDSSATHFRATKNVDKEGFFITLYRFKGLPKYGQVTCNCTSELVARDSKCHYCVSVKVGERPQYLGPLGWSFHSAVKDKDILPLLQPIAELERITGDNIGKEIWQEGNMYAG